jgi:hypothetical protein
MSGECNYCGEGHCEQGCKYEPQTDRVELDIDTLAGLRSGLEQFKDDLAAFDHICDLARLAAAVLEMPEGYSLHRKQPLRGDATLESRWQVRHNDRHFDSAENPLFALQAAGIEAGS